MGALMEAIDAIAAAEGEWWIVEALTLTLKKIEFEFEIRSILASSSNIRNGDLKARLIG